MGDRLRGWFADAVLTALVVGAAAALPLVGVTLVELVVGR